MKQIILIIVGVGILYFIGFGVFGDRATVETPEIKRTGNYERPVKDGNCYLQKDNTGNTIRVCG